jgi:hypothetical protein
MGPNAKRAKGKKKGEDEASSAAKVGGAMRAIALVKKKATQAKGKKARQSKDVNRRGGMFGPPRMTSAEDWIEVWVDERKNRDLFEQEFRGFPEKKPSRAAEVFGSTLFAVKGDQWASNGYSARLAHECFGQGGWPIEWGGPRGKAQLEKVTTLADKMIAEEYNIKELVCERQIQRLAAQREDDIRSLFVQFDEDGSGELDHGEFNQVTAAETTDARSCDANASRYTALSLSGRTSVGGTWPALHLFSRERRYCCSRH